MIKSLCGIGLVILIIALGPRAYAGDNGAACAAKIASVSPPPTINYYPYDSRMQVEPIELDIVSSGECSLSLSVATTQTGMKGGRNNLSYYIEDSHGNRIVADGSRRIAVRSKQGDGITKFFTHTPSGQNVAPGDYYEEARFQLYDSDVLIDEIIINISAAVFPQAVISVAKSRTSGLTFNDGTVLNFGNLTTGSRQSAFVFVRSNTHYSLLLESENAGRLINTTAAGTPQYIDYTAWLDRRRLNLNPRDDIHFRRNETLDSVRPHELTVEIGQITDKVAGEYHDLLTINVIILN